MSYYDTKASKIAEMRLYLYRVCGFLELTDSQVTELPEDFGRLGSLRVIILHRNQLRKLPDSFGKMNRLEIAEIDINQIEKLPDDLSGLNKSSRS